MINIIYYIIFMFLVVSCSFGQIPINNELLVTQDSTFTKNYLFKKWAKDTLLELKMNLGEEMKNSNGLRNYTIKVAIDTLSLEIVRDFEINLKSQTSIQSIHPTIVNLISLLKEYSEYPNETLTLKFTSLDYYYPSSAQDIIFDDLFEIKDIILRTADTISSYTYVRGRLNDKTETITINGKEIVNYYDFIWDGNKLIKKIR